MLALTDWTHGKDVVNTQLDNAIPGCIIRTYAARPKKGARGSGAQCRKRKEMDGGHARSRATQNLEVALDLPSETAPQSVLFASPDVATLQEPVKLDFDVVGGKLRTALPDLRVYGTLILRP